MIDNVLFLWHRIADMLQQWFAIIGLWCKEGVPLSDWFNSGVTWFTQHLTWLTQPISSGMEWCLTVLKDGLLLIPVPVLIVVVAALALWRCGKLIAVFAVVGLLMVWNQHLWGSLVYSLSLVLISTLLSIIIALPLGMLAALFRPVELVTKPILDLMQTMPAFVYLLPCVALFGIGVMPAVLATVIFAMPPAVRFTILGIQQVPGDLNEGAEAFGSTRAQKLFKLQLPIARPTIMAGINQTVMLALSMSVIASMVGAEGLGADVYSAIQSNDNGHGIVSGICVVVLAVLLDRIAQSFKGKDYI